MIWPFQFKKQEIKEIEIIRGKGNYNKFENNLLNKSFIVLIVGKRGSGKTALGMKFLEIARNKTKRRIYAIGFENSRTPFFINKVKNIEEIKQNSIVLVDEAAMLFSAREPMKNMNKLLTQIMAIARHRNLSLIFITQNSAFIDINVLRLADGIFLKEPSLLQSTFERKFLNNFYKNISFSKYSEKEKYFYIYSDDFRGMAKFDLPNFWNESVSKSFK
jgi:Cdc6-like AAA superfamily ATPase